MASLTEGQQMSLILVTFITGMLSCVCSWWIIALALMRPKRKTFHRLLLLMSAFDIVSSVAWMMQPFMIPKTEEDRIWAVGNERTCSAIGFFSQLGFGTVFYNGCLNTFYLLTIRFRMDEKKLEERVEPIFHALSVLYPLITASVGAGIGLFSPAELGSACWISEYPRNCDEDPDVTCISTMLAWIYAGVPLLGTFFYLLWSNLMIYCQVRATMKQARRRSQRASQRELFDQRGRDVGIQASLYVVACLSSIIWMIILRCLESVGIHREDEQSVYPLLLLAHFFFPLQGFWNLLIYLRPRYIRWRRREPEQSRIWCLRQSMISTGLPGDAPNNSLISSMVSRVLEPRSSSAFEGPASSSAPMVRGRRPSTESAQQKQQPARTISYESYFRSGRQDEQQHKEEREEQPKQQTKSTTLDKIHETFEEEHSERQASDDDEESPINPSAVFDRTKDQVAATSLTHVSTDTSSDNYDC